MVNYFSLKFLFCFFFVNEGKRWTREELDILRKHWNGKGMPSADVVNDIKDKLVGRSVLVIRAQMSNILKKTKK